MFTSFSVAKGRHQNKTSQKWLTVAIFQKWQDSSVALWIKIAVILEIETGDMVWFGIVWVTTGMDDEISIMDYNGLS